MPLKPVVINQITYRYPAQISPALSEISITVEPGEFLAIMGPTGAGKTTLISCLNGLIPEFYEGELNGEIKINNLSTKESRVQDLVEHVGLVLQDAETQIIGITVLEDMAFGPSNLGFPKNQIVSQIRDSLTMVGLSGYEDHLTYNLSGGEKQRLAIAGILAMQPEILILDEPTSELDPSGSVEVMDAIQRLRTQNQTTIILVGHDAENVLRLADRVFVIMNGKFGWLGEPEQLFRNVPLMKQFSIRPPQMAELSEQLHISGLINANDIALTVEDAENVVRNRMDKQMFSAQPAIQPHPDPVEKLPVIEVIDLKHTYPGGIEAISGITCAIQQGEFIAVIGQNGAGKSTLVKHFNGLLQPSSGMIKVNGIDIRTLSTKNLASQVGYVFQNPDHQIFCASVEEEIRFGLKNLGMSKKEQETCIEAALEFVGLQDQRKRHPFTLGKGERQKIAVASILAIAPPVICIDEPTTGLDWTGTLRMMELIRKLHQNGHTVIMITHNMDLVAEYAQRVLLVNRGKLLCDASPAQVFADAEILQKSGITPPQISKLVKRLADLNCPEDICTISQMVWAIKTSLQG